MRVLTSALCRRDALGVFALIFQPLCKENAIRRIRTMPSPTTRILHPSTGGCMSAPARTIVIVGDGVHCLRTRCHEQPKLLSRGRTSS